MQGKGKARSDAKEARREAKKRRIKARQSKAPRCSDPFGGLILSTFFELGAGLVTNQH